VQGSPELVSEGPIMVVDRAGQDHSGLYECRASSTEGRAKDIVKIDVLCKLNINAIKTQDENLMNNMYSPVKLYRLNFIHLV
jgi:hypothetical protein